MEEIAEEFAKLLIKEKFSVAKYQELQDRRKERLLQWEKIGVKLIIEKEKELIEYGEKVLALLIKNNE